MATTGRRRSPETRTPALQRHREFCGKTRTEIHRPLYGTKNHITGYCTARGQRPEPRKCTRQGLEKVRPRVKAPRRRDNNNPHAPYVDTQRRQSSTMSRCEHRQAQAAAQQVTPVRPAYSPPKEATVRPPTSHPRYPRSRQDQLCAALGTPPPSRRPRVPSARPARTPPTPAPTHPAPLTPAQFRAEMEALFGRISDSDPDDFMGLGDYYFIIQ
ncbi:hypothetical protein DMN91_004350 [Ooceraea biroi]|uniref:Uncharacterized protein n=1 Tax=Ooceraea biroi TaxID=2015173 RepID=A0A3L8DUK1_OOCBI|nr:hypothetical protein DMN91_004350 [Ooceraea biroi]